jgi:hypothetical protein
MYSCIDLLSKLHVLNLVHCRTHAPLDGRDRLSRYAIRHAASTKSTASLTDRPPISYLLYPWEISYEIWCILYPAPVDKLKRRTSHLVTIDQTICYHTVRRRAGLRGLYLPVKSTDILYTWVLKSTGLCEKYIDHICFRKSKFGLRREENLTELYAMTKFEFSMIRLRTIGHNVRIHI